MRAAGTGTCARMAVMHAKGQLPLHTDFVHQSIIGSEFVGRVERVIDVQLPEQIQLELPALLRECARMGKDDERDSRVNTCGSDSSHNTSAGAAADHDNDGGSDRVKTYKAIVPSIKGSAYITGYSIHVLDATDPFTDGFTVGDIWGGDAVR